MNRDVRIARRRLPLGMLGVLLAGSLAMSACSSGTGKTAGAPPSTRESVPVEVVTKPGDGAQGVNPVQPISVQVRGGTLKDIELTNQSGEQVEGKRGEDNRSWKVSEPLGYGKTYTWSGTAVGSDGRSTAIDGAFTTLEPQQRISAKLNTGDDRTYGIAMPISVTFDAPVQDKAAVEKALSVETSNDTHGAWAWLSDSSVHWRPKEYWEPGTQVNVDVGIYGVRFGEGAYGADDLTARFEIGRSQIVRANTQTHRVRVIRDGQEIANYPASFGLESDPGRVTNSGTHVVMSKHSQYSMSSEEYDYENVVVPWAVRISNNGEFIHGYAPSISAQGERNVSHGCVNLSPSDAKKYYDGALIGDPVEVTGSSKQLGPEDNAYYDWTLSWDQWTAKSSTAS